MSDSDQPGQPAPRGRLDEPPGFTPPPPQSSGTGTNTNTGSGIPGGGSATTTSFDLNHPTIISLLYLSSVILGVTALVGVVLAYVWKGEAHAEWETSHYQYLIRTFWIALIGTVVGIVLMVVLIGFLLILAVFALVVVRCVLSLINAQKRQPMPNPETWLA
jgi:uncharacterized membrane protein